MNGYSARKGPADEFSPKMVSYRLAFLSFTILASFSLCAVYRRFSPGDPGWVEVSLTQIFRVVTDAGEKTRAAKVAMHFEQMARPFFWHAG